MLALEYYGEILEVTPVTKVLYGRRIDTGERVVFFKRIARHIPSYMFVRGWRAFVRYNGKPFTCRICNLSGHFAKDCPTMRKPENKPGDKPSEDKQKSPEDKVTLMEVQSPKGQITQQEIMDTPNPGNPGTPEVLNVTQPDRKILTTPLNVPVFNELRKELFRSISDTEETSESTKKGWSMSGDELADDLAKEVQI